MCKPCTSDNMDCNSCGIQGPIPVSCLTPAQLEWQSSWPGRGSHSTDISPPCTPSHLVLILVFFPMHINPNWTLNYPAPPVFWVILKCSHKWYICSVCFLDHDFQPYQLGYIYHSSMMPTSKRSESDIKLECKLQSLICHIKNHPRKCWSPSAMSCIFELQLNGQWSGCDINGCPVAQGKSNIHMGK